MRVFRLTLSMVAILGASNMAIAQSASPTTPNTTTSVPAGAMRAPPTAGPASDSPTAQRPGPSTGTGEGTAGTATGGVPGGNPSKN